MLIIGIDPGISGSLCFFNDGKIIDLVEMPSMASRWLKIVLSGTRRNWSWPSVTTTTKGRTNERETRREELFTCFVDNSIVD